MLAWFLFFFWLGILAPVVVMMWPRIKRWWVTLRVYRWWVTPVTTFLPPRPVHEDLQAEDLEWLNGHLELAGRPRIKLATVLDKVHEGVVEASRSEAELHRLRERSRALREKSRALGRQLEELEAWGRRDAPGFTSISVDGRTISYLPTTRGGSVSYTKAEA